MNLDEIYKEETSYRRKQDRKEKYETIDYFDTVGKSSEIRNYRRKLAKKYDSYEGIFRD